MVKKKFPLFQTKIVPFHLQGQAAKDECPSGTAGLGRRRHYNLSKCW